MIRAARLLVLAVALTATLTACDPGGGGAPPPADAPSGTATPEASATSSEADGAGEGTGPQAPWCLRDALTLAYAEADASAGHLHGILTWTNRSDATCALTGYPVVHLKNPEAAVPLGGPSSTDQQDAGTDLELDPGESATANLTITQAGNVDGCTVTPSTGLLVAVPGSEFELEGTSIQNVSVSGLQGCLEDGISLLVVGGVQAG